MVRLQKPKTLIYTPTATAPIKYVTVCKQMKICIDMSFILLYNILCMFLDFDTNGSLFWNRQIAFRYIFYNTVNTERSEKMEISIIITVIVGVVALGLGFASMAKAVGRVFEKIKDTLQ